MSSRLKLALVILLVLTVIAVMLIRFTPREADTIYVNGVVHTMDDDNSLVEAFAVTGDRIVGTGSTSGIERRFRARDTVDLKGRAVFPGFIDSHGHFFSLGLAKMTVDLLGSTTEQEAAVRVRERVLTLSPGKWVRGRGWDQNEWPGRQFPTHASLDRVAPNNPAYMVRVDGHAVWVNRKAMEISGISRSTPDPAGGKIERDKEGNPTGVFVDNAVQLIQSHVPQMSDDEEMEAMHLASQECVKYGLTTIGDMGIDTTEVRLYKRLIGAGQLPLRIYAAIGGVGELWTEFLKSGPLIGYGNNHLTIRALKLYIDGALGSRGAALIEPYRDDPGNRGLTVSSEELIKSASIDALKHGFQVCTHAIGDRGNDIVLSMYAAALQEVPVHDARLRIEHAQVLDSADIPKFKQYLKEKSEYVKATGAAGADARAHRHPAGVHARGPASTNRPGEVVERYRLSLIT